MNSKGIGIMITLLIAAVGGWLWFKTTGRQSPSPTENSITTTNQPAKTEIATDSTPERMLASATAKLKAAQSTQEKADSLVLLRHALSSGSTNEMIAAIRKLLDTKTDASTGLQFKIGGGGKLLEAPTLRTFLLEELAGLDPAAAAEYAREILDSSDSPDEWAIALRNLSRGDTSASARTLLETKTGELFRKEAWQRNPSVGYLEAFDVAVHLGGTSLLPPLTELVSKKDNQAVAHAAFLTLDRLVINQPAQILAALNENPGWMRGREETRANYFARADVSDMTQRQLLETYLLDAARSPAELNTFAGIFPNANFMISHNLLTENKTLDGPTLAGRDRAALEVVNQWLTDSRFDHLKQPLATIQQRLQEFTRQSRQ